MHRHSYKGRKFSRNSGPRKALIGGLVRSLFLYESIETTDIKAKEIKPIVDKLITLAKRPGLGSKRLLASRVGSKTVTEKIIKDLLPLWDDRSSGYTRTIKIGYRSGDGALMSKIELITAGNALKLTQNSDQPEALPAPEEESKSNPKTKGSTDAKKTKAVKDGEKSAKK